MVLKRLATKKSALLDQSLRMEAIGSHTYSSPLGSSGAAAYSLDMASRMASTTVRLEVKDLPGKVHHIWIFLSLGLVLFGRLSLQILLWPFYCQAIPGETANVNALRYQSTGNGSQD